MIIFFLRHANAGQRKSLPNFDPVKDEKRPLDELGVSQSGDIGRVLARLDVHVDAILSSPLKRATQTAALVANEIGHEGALQLEPALRPDASFLAFRELLDRCAKYEAIMVVGHNPSMNEFLSMLLSRGTNSQMTDLKKGSVARVDFDRKRAILKWLVTPKMARIFHESVMAKPGMHAKKLNAKKKQAF